MNWNSIKHQNRFWALGIKRLKSLTRSLQSQSQKIRLGKITKFQRYLALSICCIFLGLTLAQFPVLSTSVNISTVRQEQSENLLSQGIINPTNSISHQREFRGVWVATVANIDWPSKSNLSVDQQKFELIAILNRMQELNLNALILQVRPNGDALYSSSIEPWSAWLTGTQGTPQIPIMIPYNLRLKKPINAILNSTLGLILIGQD